MRRVTNDTKNKVRLTYCVGQKRPPKKVDVNIGIFRPAEPRIPWDICYCVLAHVHSADVCVSSKTRV